MTGRRGRGEAGAARCDASDRGIVPGEPVHIRPPPGSPARDPDAGRNAPRHRGARALGGVRPAARHGRSRPPDAPTTRIHGEASQVQYFDTTPHAGAGPSRPGRAGSSTSGDSRAAPGRRRQRRLEAVGPAVPDDAAEGPERPPRRSQLRASRRSQAWTREGVRCVLRMRHSLGAGASAAGPARCAGRARMRPPPGGEPSRRVTGPVGDARARRPCAPHAGPSVSSAG